MALRVVQSPGCREIYSDSDLGVRENDIVIDSGSIAKSLGYDPTSPTANKALLRVASRMRGVAIARRRTKREPQRRCPNVQPAKRAASARTDGCGVGNDDPAVTRRSVPTDPQGFIRMTATGQLCVRPALDRYYTNVE